jgi:hypothetical protein
MEPLWVGHLVGPATCTVDPLPIHSAAAEIPIQVLR